MIKLITRNEIVNSKSIIGSELAKLQKAFFDSDMLDYYKATNEEQQYLERFDCIQHDVLEYSVFDKVLTLNHAEIETFTAILAKKLRALFESINVQNFFLITHLRLDLFGNRKNRYKPLVNSYKKLEKIVGNKKYCEAILFDLDSFAEIVDIIFWITRCDPSAAEYMFIVDADEKFQFTICKYGHIHLVVL